MPVRASAGLVRGATEWRRGIIGMSGEQRQMAQRRSRGLMGNDPEQVGDAFSQLPMLLHNRVVVAAPRVKEAGHGERGDATNDSRHGG